MTTEEIKNAIVEVYKEKGLKSVYYFLNKNGIKFKLNVFEFGLNTNKKAREEKYNWINNSELRFHYYSLNIKSRRSGYNYNRIRGIEIVLL